MKNWYKLAQEMKTVKDVDTLSERELLRAFRDAIVAEQGAIKQYEVISDATSNPKVKKIMQDLANEEKVHVFELQRLIDEFSKDEKDFKEKGIKEVEDMLGSK